MDYLLNWRSAESGLSRGVPRSDCARTLGHCPDARTVSGCEFDATILAATRNLHVADKDEMHVPYYPLLL